MLPGTGETGDEAVTSADDVQSGLGRYIILFN